MSAVKIIDEAGLTQFGTEAKEKQDELYLASNASRVTSVSVTGGILSVTDETGTTSTYTIGGGSSSGGTTIAQWTANTSYSAGDLIVFGQTMYKVNTAFRSGSTFDDTNLSTYVAGVMTGASSVSGGTSGLVPKPESGDDGKVLFGNGTWDTIPSMTGATSVSGGSSGFVPEPQAGDDGKVLFGNGTWDSIPAMTGASSISAGTSGFVPQPQAGDEGKVLFGNGTWDTVSGGGGASIDQWVSNTSYSVGDLLVYDGIIYEVHTAYTSGATFDDTNLDEYVAKKMVGATSLVGGASGIVPAPDAGDDIKVLFGNGTWDSIPAMVGATSVAGGASGAVPAPTTGDRWKFLTGEGTWKTAVSSVNVKKEVLWSGKAYTKGQTLTLSDSYDNYDYIVCYLGAHDSTVGDYTLYEQMIPTDQFDNLQISFADYYSVGDTTKRYMCYLVFSGSIATLDDMESLKNNDVYLCLIEGIKFVPNENDYSTTERQIGTWIDGKPLYQITMTGTTGNTNTTDIDISSLNFDVGVDIFGTIDTVPLGFYQNTTDFVSGQIYKDSSSECVSIHYANSYKNKPYIVTIKYTKTTD